MKHLGLVTFLIVTITLFSSLESRAEYGDVILNEFSESAGMSPVVFPHWFHRIRYTCKTCHTDLGFQLKAGANKIKMVDILEGQFCGQCHNGEIAWGSENCHLCHSAKAHIKTRIEKSNLQKLLDINPKSDSN